MMKMLNRFSFGSKISKQNKKRKLKENFIFVKNSMTAQTNVNKREYVLINIKIRLENGDVTHILICTHKLSKINFKCIISSIINNYNTNTSCFA